MVTYVWHFSGSESFPELVSIPARRCSRGVAQAEGDRIASFVLEYGPQEPAVR